MNIRYEENYSDFNIKFGGENEIEASTLVGTIYEVIESLELIKSKLEPEANIKIRVAPFESGSFILNLKALIETSKELFSQENLTIATSIVTFLLGAIEIKKHLKGEKPKNVNYVGDDAIIVNEDNETLKKNKNVAETYFQDSNIDRRITNIINIVQIDGNRDGLVIKQGEDNVVEIKKEEFEKMSKQVITQEDTIVGTLVNEIKVELLLKKPDLLGRSKWGFVFDKNIEATMQDEEWLQKVQSGVIVLPAGVIIPVNLKIESDLDTDNNHIATRYTVLKVTGDIIEPNKDSWEQLRFD